MEKNINSKQHGIQRFNLSNRRYTGSKLKIIDWIKETIINECKNCKTFCDIFAGTASVSHSLIDKFDTFILNDFLFSNFIIYKAFFSKEQFDQNKINSFYLKYKNINVQNLSNNYFSRNFGQKYFSDNDSKIIGFIRDDIQLNRKILNNKEYAILISSLIYSLDKIANTVGHYDAFIKNNKIKDRFIFSLIEPIVHQKKIKIFKENSNLLVKKISPDIIYIDPPYNSRQYSRFYHLLENITKWDKPKLHGTAMKRYPAENMSNYCLNKAKEEFEDLINNIKCKYIVVSYNNTYKSKSSSSKNKITLDTIKKILNKKGFTKRFFRKHKHFNSGKTNFKDHKEFLFVTKVLN